MPSFSREILVNAAREKVWQVVSDVDNEPFYWHGTREVINRRKDGNLIERTIVQNFMGTRIDQRVRLEPMERVVTEYLKGVTVGTKTVTVSGDGAEQTVKTEWDVRFTGLVWLISPYVKRHVTKGTENALARIKETAEGRSQPGGSR